MDNFVVYAYCRKDGTFYYIGKGKPYRPYSDDRKGARKPKDLSRILILHEGLPEATALDYHNDEGQTHQFKSPPPKGWKLGRKPQHTTKP